MSVVPKYADDMAEMYSLQVSEVTPDAGVSCRYKIQSLLGYGRDAIIKDRSAKKTLRSVFEATAKRLTSEEDLISCLKKSKKIRKVRFDGQKLKIDTRVLYVTDPFGGRRMLGKMRIEIDTSQSGPRRGIKVYNLSYPASEMKGPTRGYPAPHVDRRGRPCFGETFYDILLGLWMGCDFPTISCLLIQFLETTNAGQEYMKANAWPYKPRRTKR